MNDSKAELVSILLRLYACTDIPKEFRESALRAADRLDNIVKK